MNQPMLNRFVTYCRLVWVRITRTSFKNALIGVFISLFVVSVLRDIYWGMPLPSIAEAEKRQAELEAAFRQLPVPDKVTPLNFSYSTRPEKALIGRAFISDMDYKDTEKFYDAELSKLHWIPVSEEPVREWGIDYGGHRRLYCNKPYEAELFFSGEKAPERGWTYMLTFVWPPSPECLHDRS